MHSVESLRKSGYIVRVTHNRRRGVYTGKYNILTTHAHTVVCISDRSGGIWYGTANCSDKDQFNRKLGTRIALGRALKQMGLSTK